MRASPTPLVLTLSLLATFQAFAVRPVRYVKANAPNGGNGQTWATAYNKLQDALAAAQAGDDIWVALGTYYPDQGGTAVNDDRNSTFALKDDVAIYGGFSGSNTDFSSRNPQVNVTILHGDISSSPLFHTDRAYHVVTAHLVNNTAILDGFTITEGNADFVTEPDCSGSGLYCDTASPKIANCKFTANKSLRLGGAVHMEKASTPSFTNCTFSGNSNTERAGGAVFTDGANATFVDCAFTSNTSAGDGGALYIRATSCTLTNCTFTSNTSARQGGALLVEGSSPTLTGCTFSQNTASFKGGAIFASRSTYTMGTCSFSQNSSPSGGAVYNFGSSPTATGCIFTSNSATNDGGAMMNTTDTSAPERRSNPNLTSCTFTGNTANSGAGLFCAGGENSPSAPVVTNCTFTSNIANSYGGSAYFTETTPQVTGSTFTTNSSGNSGGGIYLLRVVNAVLGSSAFNGNQGVAGGALYLNLGALSVTGSSFTGNSTTSGGGALYLSSPDAVGFTTCSFSGNSSAYGGVISISGSGPGTDAPAFVNCAFTGNNALTNAGLMYCTAASPVFRSCVIAGNSSVAGIAAVNCNGGGTPSFTNVTVSGNAADYNGTLVFNATNPSFTNCIIYNNLGSSSSAGDLPRDSLSFDNGAAGTFSYCLVANFSKATLDAGASPDTNFAPLDPQFVTPVSPASAPTTLGNLSLKTGSPAIDVGSNAALSLTLDLAGNPRVSNSIIDLGAFEYQGPDPFFADTDGDGISNGLELALGTSPSLADPANPRNLRILPASITFGYDSSTAAGTALELRRSTDLINFNVVVASSITGFPAAGPGGIVTITDPTRPAGKAFYRLQAAPR